MYRQAKSKFNSDEISMMLSGVKIFEDLNFGITTDIASFMHIGDFMKNQKLLEHGKSNDLLFIIVSGSVDVISTDENAKSKKLTLKKGSVLGEMSLLVKAANTADFVARENTRVLFLERKSFFILINRYKVFLHILLQLMVDRIADIGGINQIGKYQLTEKLDEGNMTIAFQAKDYEANREVVIKMLKYKLAHDSQFIQRFKREAKVIVKLKHPHIVKTYEVLNEFSTHFIVTEKLEGVNLADRLKESGPFTPLQTREVLKQLGSALKYSHPKIIHRDIKPENIILDTNGDIKLSNFGLSCLSSNTQSNIKDSPDYLAPEAFDGKEVDGRADIYSLGILAFYLLTNRLPFVASSFEELRRMHTLYDVPDIRKICDGIDDKLVEFIQCSVEKNVKKRIKNWQEICDLLGFVSLSETTHSKLNTPQDDEMIVVIRLKKISYKEAATIINPLQKTLLNSGFKHCIELR
ncbi:MAG: protein kinase [Gammaproteobacteria bacterium]|nr:protein kinase [Gammaproteobacteria bacterium]